jgi:hypothetical protein
MSDHEYSQGICGDGAAILKDGQPMTIEEIVDELQKGQAVRAQSGQGAEAEGWQAMIDRIVPDISPEPDQDLYPAEWSLWADRQRIRQELSLLSTPTTPKADGWVSMADREPTKSDEDCEDKIWLLWPDRRYFERVPRSHVSCAPEFYWMPTGLKRPQPPKR